MRFIIRELPYERPLAAGQMRYELNDQVTGAVENWRLTSAASGYRFLRVDLDARNAESGDSYLYHLVLDASGRPERLSYRFWGHGLQVTGNVLLDSGNLTASRQVNGTRYEDLVEFTASCGFWFPSSIGLGLLGNCAQGGDPPGAGIARAITLDAALDRMPLEEAQFFALRPVEVELRLGNSERLQFLGQEVMVRPFTIRWLDQERTIWLDNTNWPLKMARSDGLTSIETRHIRYT
jgi:hypothetical protein